MSADQVFVSFSGRAAKDHYFGGRLLSRLRECGLEAWMFEEPGEGIRAGDDILKACRDRIAAAKLFIAMISESSLASKYTHDEVAFANDLRSRGAVILPVSTVALEGAAWPAPYDSLHDKIVHRCNVDDLSTLEPVLEDICDRCGLPYSFPFEGPKSFPLGRRLEHELHESLSTDGVVSNGVRHRLREHVHGVLKAYEQGKLENASTEIDSLLLLAEKHMPKNHLYYARVSQAMLDAEIANLHNDQGRLERAAARFLKLIGPEPHPRLDENAYAGVGLIRLWTGRFDEARKYFEMARRIAKGVDYDILFGLAMSYLQADKPAAGEIRKSILKHVADGCPSRSPDEAARFRALAWLLQVTSFPAYDVADDETSESVLKGGADILFYATDHCVKRSEKSGDERWRTRAEALLRAFSELPLPDIDIDNSLHRLARVVFVDGRFDEAHGIHLVLVKRRPRNVQLLIDAAISALTVGNHEASKKLATSASEYKWFSTGDHLDAGNDLPAEKNFHYYAGFAEFLTGEFDAAVCRFRLSGRDGDEWYPQVLAEYGIY